MKNPFSTHPKFSAFDIISSKETKMFSTAHAIKAGEHYFIKIADNAETNARLSNEVAWNTQLGEFAQTQTQPFVFPKIRETGEADGHAYAVFDYYDPSNSLAPAYGHQGFDEDRFKGQLDRIIDFLFWLRTISVQLPADVSKKPRKLIYTREEALAQAMEYSRQIDGRFPELIDLIRTINFEEATFLAHGDLNLSHFLDLDRILGIVDGEMSSDRLPTHTDIVVLYSRTFAATQKPDMAELLLVRYEDRCKQEGFNMCQFRDQFRGLLAIRTLSEYRDEYIKKRLNPEHLTLAERVLSF